MSPLPPVFHFSASFLFFSFFLRFFFLIFSLLLSSDVMDVICQCMEVRSSTEDSTQSRLSQLSGCSFNVDSRRSSVLDVSACASVPSYDTVMNRNGMTRVLWVCPVIATVYRRYMYACGLRNTVLLFSRKLISLTASMGERTEVLGERRCQPMTQLFFGDCCI